MTTFQIAMAVIGIGVTIMMAILGWLVSGLKGAMGVMNDGIKENAKGLADHRVEVARDYATRESVNTGLNALEERLVKRVDSMETTMGKWFDGVFNMLRSGGKNE